MIHVKKWSDRNMEVQSPALLGNYDRPTDQPTGGQKGLKLG